MNISPIDDGFHVTGQLKPKQFAEVAAKGYRTVICMRPDHEGFLQPVYAEIATAAENAGLEICYLPVVPGQVTPSQVTELKEILAARPKPVLAFCASGNRCAAIYEMCKR